MRFRFALLVIFASLFAAPSLAEFTYGGSSGNAMVKIIDGRVSDQLAFDAAPVSNYRPEDVTWDYNNNTFLSVTDTGTVFAWWTRSGTGTSAIGNIQSTTIDTWLGADAAERNPHGYFADQLRLEWEILALHPLTGDAYVINTPNSETNCTDRSGSSDPKDVAYIFQLQWNGSIWEPVKNWRLPSANGSGAQCTSGLNNYPAFVNDYDRLMIDNQGRFFVGDDNDMFEITLPTGTVAQSAANHEATYTETFPTSAFDLDSMWGCSKSGAQRGDYDPSTGRFYVICADGQAGNLDFGVCTDSDPPCRLEIYVIDWTSRKTLGVIDLSGQDDTSGPGSNGPADFERPRSLALMSSGSDQATIDTDGFERIFLFDDDSDQSTNATSLEIFTRNASLGSFEHTFIMVPGDGSEHIFRPMGAVNITKIDCRVIDPIPTSAGFASLTAFTSTKNRAIQQAPFFPTPIWCAPSGGHGGRVVSSAAELDPGELIEFSAANISGTTSLLQVTIHGERVSHPR